MVGEGGCVVAGVETAFAVKSAGKPEEPKEIIWDKSCVIIKKVASHFIGSPHAPVRIVLSRGFGSIVFA